MIYLVKKICTKCNMKIELTDQHFGLDLQCPNCDADISIPNVNKMAEETERLVKELEDLKNDSNFTQTNTISMGRPGQTIKVQAASSTADTAASSEELKKQKELNEKLRKEEQVLNGKLKGLQAANMAMNDELTKLKAQKDEFDKSLDEVKKLQKQLSDKEQELSQVKTKLAKYTQITQNLKDISTVGEHDVKTDEDAFAETIAAPALSSSVEDAFAETMVAEPEKSEDSMAETQESPTSSNLELVETIVAKTELKEEEDPCFAETMVTPPGVNVMEETISVPKSNMDEIGKDKFDETLQVTMDAVKVTERECSACGIEYVYTAKFCPKCGAKNENYQD